MDPDFFLDDIGSYPLPKGVSLKGLSDDGYRDLVIDAFSQKVLAGVEVPTYPQFRDMIRMFMDPIQDPEASESPYHIKKERALIPELEMVESLNSERIRVCVTGPVELYLSAFGATSYTDILFEIAGSVARFMENAVESNRVSVTSIDEPSLGISPMVTFSEDEIAQALEIASKPCLGMDCEVHLHSPLFAELCCRVPGISIIGVESAAHPDYLRLIDRKVLVETDTYLRAGIARTDILSMAASINDRLGGNIWDDPIALENEILGMESPDVIRARLKHDHSMFKDRLKAVGPDCGLGSWPSQATAYKLLSNCSVAVTSFRKNAV